MIASDCTSFYFFLDPTTLNICYNQHRSLHDIQTYTYAVAVDRPLADPMLYGVPCGSGIPKEENANICCGFFQTELLEGSESNFSNNYMKAPNYYVEGNARPVTYATAYMWIIHTHTFFFAITSHSSCIYYLLN